MLGRVGDDVFGRAVGEMLRQQGVDVGGLQISADADTSQTLIVNVTARDGAAITNTANVGAATVRVESVAHAGP